MNRTFMTKISSSVITHSGPDLVITGLSICTWEMWRGLWNLVQFHNHQKSVVFLGPMALPPCQAWWQELLSPWSRRSPKFWALSDVESVMLTENTQIYQQVALAPEKSCYFPACVFPFIIVIFWVLIVFIYDLKKGRFVTISRVVTNCLNSKQIC